MRFDKLLGDIETTLADSPWLAGKEFSLADIGYAPYITRLDHLQLQFLWDKRPAYSRLVRSPARAERVHRSAGEMVQSRIICR